VKNLNVENDLKHKNHPIPKRKQDGAQ